MSNDAYCRYYGQPREALIGRKWMEVVAEEDQERVKEHVGRLVACLSPANPTMTEEHQEIGVGGSIRWQQWTDQALFDEQGHLVEFQSVGRDITERKRVEEALAAERSLLRAIIDILPALIYVKDTTCRKIIANHVDLEYMGASTEAEALGKTDFDFYPQDMAARFYARDQAIIQTGQPLLDYEHSILRADGQERWLLTSKVPLRDSAGHVIGLVGVGLDITERRQAEEALRAALETANQSRQALLSVIEDHRQVEEALTTERSLLRTLVDHLPDAIYVKDAACRKTLVNPADYHNIGVATEAEALGKTDFELFPPDLAARFYADDLHVIQSGQPILNREEEITRPDRTRGWQVTSKIPLYDSAGQVVGLVGIGHDITERRQAEEMLRWTEQRYRNLFEGAPLMYIITRSQEGIPIIVDCNQAFTDTLGYARDAVIGRPLADFYVPESRAALLEGGYRRALGDGLGVAERRLVARDGRIIETVLTALPETDAQGNVTGTRAMYMDITARKRAEEALQRSETFLDSIIEHSPHSTWISDDQGVLIRLNQACCDLLHITADEMVGKYNVLQDNIVAEQGLMPLVKQVFEQGQTVKFTLRYDSSRFQPIALAETVFVILDVTISPVLDGYGRVVNAIIQHVDITERKRAEEALIASETRYRRLFEAARDGILILDADTGMIVDVNPYLGELLGFAPATLLNKQVWELGFFKDIIANQANFRELQQKGYIRYEDMPLETADGRRIEVEFVSNVYLIDHKQVIQCNIRDITERKQAEQLLQRYTEQLEAMVAARTRDLEAAQERLLRQERLTVLGQVAGGIAHELRTPLGAIKNAAYLLNLLLEPAEATVKEALDILNREVDASDRIITSLFNFTRPHRPARQVVAVGQVVMQALQRAQTPPQVQVEQHIDALPAILTDATQLEQVLSNLILNAVQAMPDGGRLTLRARQTTTLPDTVTAGFLPEPSSAGPSDGAVTGWIVVSIADTGIGIAPEHLGRLFEPLFTTKAKGMGLGLALVKLLIQANGGGIAVESVPGQGSTFTVYVPVVQE